MTEPTLLSTVDKLRRWRAGRAGECVAFVPTMGNLHAGHQALIAAARKRADAVLVSVFVNPTQFSPGEDYRRYPRTLAEDLRLAAASGADAVFAPTPEDMYPFGTQGASTIAVPAFADTLEGASRPGHFSGVASVVARLFNLAAPDFALFGEKDYQQLLVIRRMVSDLFLPVEIVGAATVRETDGLAMSSRNAYLSPEERTRAAALYRALVAAAESLRGGAPVAEVEQAGRGTLDRAGFAPEYFAVRDAHTLAAPAEDGERVILAAARLGRARLIDNIRVPS